MAESKIGLQTHIWNNNVKSMALLVFYPILMIVIVWLCALVVTNIVMPHPVIDSYQNTNRFHSIFANDIITQYWPLIMTGVIGWFAAAWFFHTSMIRKLSHSHPVTRKEEPELYNLLENLSITAGVPTPRLEIIETHARNAFASGIDQKSFTVTVTRGLMNALTKDELEGVLAHELVHILNRDVRLLIITIIFTGMIGFAAQMLWSQIRYGYIFSGRSREKGGGILIILGLAAVLWLGYILTLCTRFAISRKREYMADAGAVQLTKNPEAMMRALQRIAGRDHIPETTGDIAMMCIENHKPFMGLFATHPPIKKRIHALAETTGTSIPQMSLPPASKQERFQQKEHQNPWLPRNRGHRRKR
ncbi:MAG: M48 family metallopeptidase [Bdellovibrionales bacterium]